MAEFIAILHTGNYEDACDPAQDTVSCSGKTLMAGLRTAFHQRLLQEQQPPDQARARVSQIKGALVFERSRYEELMAQCPEGQDGLKYLEQACRFRFGARLEQEAVKQATLVRTDQDDESSVLQRQRRQHADKLVQQVERQREQRKRLVR